MAVRLSQATSKVGPLFGRSGVFTFRSGQSRRRDAGSEELRCQKAGFHFAGRWLRGES